MGKLEAAAEARRLYGLRPVVLDTETTGLVDSSEVIEIGVIDHDGSVLLDTLVQPTNLVPSKATEVHGIGVAEIAAAPTFPWILLQLDPVITGRIVLAYGMVFDLRMLYQSARASYCLPEWNSVRIEVAKEGCVMELFAEFHGEWKEHFKSYTWKKLTDAATLCGVEEAGRPHRAITDARLTLGVLRFMAEFEE